MGFEDPERSLAATKLAADKRRLTPICLFFPSAFLWVHRRPYCPVLESSRHNKIRMVSSTNVLARYLAGDEAAQFAAAERIARVQGLRAGVEYAQALYAHDPLIFDSLAPLTRAARRF